MTKSDPGTLATLYRQSRLATWTNNASQLYIPRTKSSTPPSRQVLSSTPASLNRSDFGLKQSMPSKYKGRYITIDSLNSETGILDYSSGSMAYKLKKMRQLPGAVTPIRNSMTPGTAFSSFFTGSTVNGYPDLERKPKKLRDRQTFLNWLHSQNESIKTLHNSPEQQKRLFEKYLSSSRKEDYNTEASLTSHKTQKPSLCLATAGLRYNLPGTLMNTPQGVTKSITVPGRVLERNGVTAAVSGVIGRSDLAFFVSEPSPQTLTKTYPLHIQRMSVTERGGVNISVRQPRVRARTSPGLIKTLQSNQTKKGREEVDALYANINNTLYS
jgi:hypothetical protein